MDLWIRSQDKTKLMKVDEVEFQQDDYGFYIFAWKDKFEGSKTGTYKTKERALEVLDEIHNHLEKLFWFNPQIEEDRRISRLIESYVYKMPKE